MKLDFYDFFSGCGGTSRAMQDVGMDVRFGLDVDPDASRTYKDNFKNAKFICSDIRQVSIKDVAPYIKRRYRRPFLFGACAPCQPFSMQNRNCEIDDERRSLLGEFHRFVEAFLPEYIFVENVPGLQAVGKGEGPFAAFLQLLNRLNYHHEHGIVMAYHYGVPQKRRRLVLIASRLGPIEMPKPTHGPGTDNPDLPTVWEWISELPPIGAGETHAEDLNHRSAKLSSLNQRRVAATPVGGDRRDWPPELELLCHKQHSGHTDVYGRMIKDRPASALTTRCISLSNGRFGHPTQNRAISVREASRIQTFPLNFSFHGNLNSMARQVGNAVPVLMAQVFGRLIIDHFSCHRKARSA